jgi:hypothetical protein
MTDNIAVLQGYTEEVVADNASYTFFLMIKPDTDLDSTFTAWNTDDQEYIRINGWMFSFEWLRPAADY